MSESKFKLGNLQIAGLIIALAGIAAYKTLWPWTPYWVDVIIILGGVVIAALKKLKRNSIDE